MNACVENPDTWMGPLAEFAKGIARREGLSANEATSLASDVRDLHPELRQAFKSWWDTGTIPEAPTPHGYSLQRIIIEGWTESIVAAFTFLDHLLKDPQPVLEMLSKGARRYSLLTEGGRPFDGAEFAAEVERRNLKKNP